MVDFLSRLVHLAHAPVSRNQRTARPDVRVARRCAALHRPRRVAGWRATTSSRARATKRPCVARREPAAKTVPGGALASRDWQLASNGTSSRSRHDQPAASRRLRWVTLGFASVAAIALFLLATATANTTCSPSLQHARADQRRPRRAADARRGRAAAVVVVQPAPACLDRGSQHGSCCCSSSLPACRVCWCMPYRRSPSPQH